MNQWRPEFDGLLAYLTAAKKDQESQQQEIFDAPQLNISARSPDANDEIEVGEFFDLTPQQQQKGSSKKATSPYEHAIIQNKLFKKKWENVEFHEVKDLLNDPDAFEELSANFAPFLLTIR